jgi:hypothetical protein
LSNGQGISRRGFPPPRTSIEAGGGGESIYHFFARKVKVDKKKWPWAEIEGREAGEHCSLSKVCQNDPKMIAK